MLPFFFLSRPCYSTTVEFLPIILLWFVRRVRVLCSLSWNVCIHVGRILLSMLIRLSTKQTHKEKFWTKRFIFSWSFEKKVVFSQLKVSSIKSVNKSKHFNFAETAFLLGKECECFNVGHLEKLCILYHHVAHSGREGKAAAQVYFLERGNLPGLLQSSEYRSAFRHPLHIQQTYYNLGHFFQFHFLLQVLQYCCHKIL